MLILECYFACDCGMSHATTFRFKDADSFIRWILVEHTNVESIISLKEVN